MVRIEIVGDVRITTRPGLEGLELRFRLGHVTVEIVEVAEIPGAEPCVLVRRVESFVVFNVDEDAVFVRQRDQVEMVGEELGRGFGDHDVDRPLDRIPCDVVVCRVRGEDGDGGSGR